MRRAWAPLCITLGLVIAGCGTSGMGTDVGAASQQDYGTTKQMVLDILHSQEGKTALEDVLKDPSMKQQLVVSDSDITKALTASIESKKTQSFLSEQAKDPKFAQALAKAVQPELLQTSKQLMKDPAYQKDILVLLQSPEFSKYLQTLFQTPQFRQSMMSIMTEALDTPSFRMKFEAQLKQAVTDSMKNAAPSGGQSKQSSSNSSDSSDSGGGDGGGGDSEGGGDGGGS